MDKNQETQKKVIEIWEKTKVALKKLGHETVIIAKKGEKEVLKATRAGKLQVDILSKKNKKDNVFRQMGKKTYELSKAGKLEQASLSVLVKEIDAIDGQIHTMSQNIKKIYTKKGSGAKPAAVSEKLPAKKTAEKSVGGK